MDSNEPDSKECLTVADVDIDFLTLIYEIIRSIEKESHDSSQKTTQSQDISQKVLELNKKLNQAREQVSITY
ncbi:uncharacterized protein LOC103518281 [Diaphorina citri]|uniref:Mediator of RNA polymerase II transcription subunit 9 n=1 Tax=Diaphorina citri TaxID=121845 RepID=A0A3Q0JBB3_DIACI|nr:uncharacterized protein LOC103518281 [Diaphorina citri]